MGKYADITPNLPKLEETFSDRVAAKRDALRYQTTVALLREYLDARKRKDNLEAELSLVEEVIQAAGSLIVVRYEEEGITSMRTRTHAISHQVEPVAKVSDAHALRAWAVDNGFEARMALPWQTVNALTKERLLAGEAPPPGVEVYALDKLKVTK